MNQGKKDSNGWLIAVVIGIVVCIIGIVVGAIALVYAIGKVEAGSSKSVTSMREQAVLEEPDTKDDFDFDYDYHYREGETEEEPPEEETQNGKSEKEREESRETIDSSEYGYIDEKTGEEYYEKLKDAIRYDLDYSVAWESYDYDSEYENVMIYASYPKLEGDKIPNLDYINDYIFKEVDFWVGSFEDYTEEGYFQQDEQEFLMDIFCYVTYMDEEKISIVFSEYGYMDDYYMTYLYSVNVDVQNGVILENSSIINMDDAFAVEFRNRNKAQNGAEGYIDELTDQEIVEYLNSPTMGCVFYTPLGLEVGINLDNGWYTVTFKDYEKYLKKL